MRGLSLAEEVEAAVRDVQGGLTSLAVEEGGGGDASTATEVRLTLQLLEGTQLSVRFSASGVLVVGDGARFDDLHALLMRRSPAYGEWYLGRVAAALAGAAHDRFDESDGSETVQEASPLHR
jgi:hypothetical protein